MRGFIVMAMFAMSFSQAASRGYSENRNLELDAAGLSQVSIDAGAGSLVVNGVEGSGEVVVVATIYVGTDDEEEARSFIEKRVRLELERDGDTAKLKAGFKPGWGSDDEAGIDLDVHMPAQFALRIDDGSGATTVSGIQGSVSIDDGSGPIEVARSGDIDIDDGSGSIRLENTGGVKIDDGSGSITIIRAGGDVYVEDGSGTIEIQGVMGSVTIDDGSGDIEIDDVERDLIIEEEGSGSLRFTNVRGVVQQDD